MGKIREFLELGEGVLCGDHQYGGCGFCGRGFSIRGSFLFRLSSGQNSGFCGFGLKYLRPGRPPGGGHFRFLVRLCDRLWGGIWIRVWRGGGLNDTTPSHDVVPPIPRSICSAEGSARCSLEAAGLLVATCLRTRTGACYAMDAEPSQLKPKF